MLKMLGVGDLILCEGTRQQVLCIKYTLLSYHFFEAIMLKLSMKISNDLCEQYKDAHPLIRSGDILLCSGKGAFSTLIKNFTGSEWSHVAFILAVPQINRLMVLESVESIGVRTVPLSAYMRNYNGTGQPYAGKMKIVRHKDFSSNMLHDLSRKAVDLLGHQYDQSEITRIVARIMFSTVQKIPKGDDDYICSEYVYECFKSVGIEFKHDHRGFIAPKDFAEDPNVEYLFDIF
jgi:hypothetical protein